MLGAINDTDRIFSALTYIDAADRDTWVRLGMAIKSELGEHGFDTWDTWGQTADSYSAADSKTVWRSIKPDGKVGIGSLFHEAKQRGWQDNGKRHIPTAAEIEQHKRDAAERAAADAAEIERERSDTAQKAAAILKASTPASDDNPYLLSKMVSPTKTLREIEAADAARTLGYAPKSSGEPLEGRLLVVPVKQGDKVSTLELIDGKGRKSALAGRGSKAGGYWATERPGDDLGVLLLGEGMATSLSASAATGHPGIAALASGNLLAVAHVMRVRHPSAEIVLLADLVKTTGLPDPHAVRAAQAVGGKLAVPDFGPERDPGQKDFNDMLVAVGAEAVKQAVISASKPVKAEYEVGGDKPAEGNPAAWAEPLPLPKLPPVPELPLDILPDALRSYIQDAADRARFRPDFAAVASMAALGSVIGRKLGIRLKQRDSWTEYANVWGGIIGTPATLKSPSFREALRPFKALQADADASHARAMEAYGVELEAYKLRREAKKKEAAKALSKASDSEIDLGSLAPPAEPIPRAYWTSNVNDASLGVLLAQNQNGVLIERDELSSLLVNLENEQNADLRGMMLSGWSGNEGYRFDRIQRGVTLLPKFALSVLGGIQPGPLARYVRNAFSGERADGLLQRFQLLVWPEPESFEYVDRYPDRDAKKAAFDLFKHADDFDPERIGIRDDFGSNPPFVRLSDGAQEIFIDWYTRFMRSRRAAEVDGGESGPLAAHFGKYPGLLGKLALILHVADDPEAREVSEDTIIKALAWIDYLTPHARRVYHAVDHPETGAAELLLARIKRGDLPQSFKAWEINRKAWHGLGDREVVKKACRLLLEYGWLIEVDPGGATGGRPADAIYAVSPAVKVKS